MKNDLVISTADGTFAVPDADLQKYRIPTPEGAFETTGTVTIDPNLLRPGTNLILRIGTKPVIRTKGSIIFSAETVASSSRAE